MKTFMLKALNIIEENEDGNVIHKEIKLIDGLIINREDEENQWIIEAYTDRKYLSYFEKLRDKNDIMIEVKITKESNAPATFMTSMIGLNEIDSQMNVLFKGTIAIDQHNSRIEHMLKKLIDKGYHGEELLEKFKVSIHKK